MTSTEQASSHYEAGEFAKARQAAVEGLSTNPDDVNLLRLAGRAGVETGADDATAQLRKVAELEPESAEAWRDVGDALAADGRTEEANDAFRRVLEIEPEDEAALTALGHTAFQSGNRDEGVSMLEQVVGRVSGASTAAISLVEMYKSLGQPDEALTAARRIAQADPDNALAQLDVAELALQTGSADEAAEAFGRLRGLVTMPEDEVGALHGMIKAELARAHAERALDLAREASAIDSVGRTPGVLAHLEADLGAEQTTDDAIARGQTVAYVQAVQAPPTRDEVEALIDATLADLRRSLIGEGRG
jgi:tetratricopeptide (TPR) repeat protein